MRAAATAQSEYSLGVLAPLVPWLMVMISGLAHELEP
jgi:hypothetical protein